MHNSRGKVFTIDLFFEYQEIKAAPSKKMREKNTYIYVIMIIIK